MTASTTTGAPTRSPPPLQPSRTSPSRAPARWTTPSSSRGRPTAASCGWCTPSPVRTRAGCRPTASSTARSPGCSSTSVCCSWQPTRRFRCWSGPGFLSIFTSNLDEFFMVRVAGLKRRIATGLAVRSASGLEPREVLEQISLVAHELQAMQSAVFTERVRPALADEGIAIVRWDQLTEEERERLTDLFAAQVFPVLTPPVRRPRAPLPLHLRPLAEPGGRAHQRQDGQGALRPGEGAAAAAPAAAHRPQAGESAVADLFSTRFVPLEDVIAAHLDMLFPGDGGP